MEMLHRHAVRFSNSEGPKFHPAHPLYDITATQNSVSTRNLSNLSIHKMHLNVEQKGLHLRIIITCKTTNLKQSEMTIVELTVSLNFSAEVV